MMMSQATLESVDPREVVQQLAQKNQPGRHGVPVVDYVRRMEQLGATGEAAVRALEGLIKDGTLQLTSKYTIEL